MSSLEEWLNHRWLVRHPISEQEAGQLHALFQRQMRDAAIAELSLDNRVAILYQAGLVLCEMALRSQGYRVGTKDRHHERTIESLRLILGNEYGDTVRVLQAARVARNRTQYEVVGSATETDLRAIGAEIARLLPAVVARLRAAGIDVE
jgi:hypothetical protein